MSVRKKNLPVRNLKVYPLDLDVSKLCFVRFYIATGVKKSITIPKRFDTIEKRRIESLRIVKDLLENGYSEKIESVRSSIIPVFSMLYEVIEKLKATKKTKAAYEGHIKAFEKYCIDNSIRTITGNVCQEFLESLEGKAGRTVNSYRRDLKAIFARLVRRGKIKTNPFLQTDPATTIPAFSEHYSDADMCLILKEIRLNHSALLLPLLTIYYCFIRNGNELPHIKINDIDFENGKIWVNAEFAKNKRKQAVLIPSQLMGEYRKANLDKYDGDLFAFGRDGAPSQKAVSVNFYQSKFRNVLKILGIYKKGKGIYRMKNTGNVKLVKANFNRTAIQKQNRHASFSTTEAYISSLQVDDFTELRDNFPSL